MQKTQKLDLIQLQLDHYFFTVHPIFSEMGLDVFLDDTRFPAHFLNNKLRARKYLESRLCHVARTDKKKSFYLLDLTANAIFSRHNQSSFEQLQLNCIVLPKQLITPSLIHSNIIASIAVARAAKHSMTDNQLYKLLSTEPDDVHGLASEALAVSDFDTKLQKTLYRKTSTPCPNIEGLEEQGRLI